MTIPSRRLPHLKHHTPMKDLSTLGLPNIPLVLVVGNEVVDDVLFLKPSALDDEDHRPVVSSQVISIPSVGGA